MRFFPFSSLQRPPVPAPVVAPVVAPVAADVLDRRALQALEQLDPDGSAHLVQRVLATYLQSLDRLVAQLRQSRQAQDYPSLRLAVHTLKSSSASIGALVLSDWCASAERALREDRLEDVDGLCEGLLAEALRVDDAVRRTLAD